MQYSYLALAAQLVQDIQAGRRLVGERLPSVREGPMAASAAYSALRAASP
jgi:DNA-binding transcriptional regulator YhcF (GntR family)